MSGAKVSALDVLSRHLGQWVNDLDIIDEAGLGSIVELRNLRKAGTPLRLRPNPDGDGLQWRLDEMPRATLSPVRAKPFPIERTPAGGFKLRELTCWDCGGTYTLPSTEHYNSAEHRAWIAGERAKTQISVWDGLKDEPVKPLPPTSKLVFGDVKMCPRCRGVLRPERKDRKGNVLPADTVCMDPNGREEPCRRCKGTGVVELDRARQ